MGALPTTRTVNARLRAAGYEPNARGPQAKRTHTGQVVQSSGAMPIKTEAWTGGSVLIRHFPGLRYNPRASWEERQASLDALDAKVQALFPEFTVTRTNFGGHLVTPKAD